MPSISSGTATRAFSSAESSIAAPVDRIAFWETSWITCSSTTADELKR